MPSAQIETTCGQSAHHRAAASGLHERLRCPGARDERVGRDVERHPESVTRSVDEAPLEILCGSEGNRMDEDVEPSAERLAGLGEDAGDIVVRADVALCHEPGVDGLRQLADALLDPLALEGECELGTFVVEPPRDRPCDRALVRNPEDECLLAFEAAGHATILL